MPSFFLEPDRTEPHIPASVLAVVAFGFSTSAFLVGIKPWSKTCASVTLHACSSVPLTLPRCTTQRQCWTG
jgi:hypothetical protein